MSLIVTGLYAKPSLRAGFWPNGSLTDSKLSSSHQIFLGYCHWIFSPHFCWKKGPEKTFPEDAWKNSPQCIQQNARHILADWLRQQVGAVPDILWWDGGLPHEGVGAKKFFMSLETQGKQTFWRDAQDFGWDIRGCPKSLRKNVQFLAPMRML